MAIVNLEVMGWVAAECRYKKAGRWLLEENVEKGATIGELLHRIAQRDPCFRKAIFDSNMTIQGYLSIVLNGQILGQPTFLDSRLNDGDTVMLLPAIDGG